MEVIKEGETAPEMTGDKPIETPIQERDYEFTNSEKCELNDHMEKIRANYVTIEELGRLNRKYSEELHNRIREIHPALKEVDYVFNPTTYKIQFHKK
jgi:hypothetical protein